MDLMTLVSATVAALTPYFGKMADGAATKLGEYSAEGVGRLYHWLREKLATPSAAEALEELRQRPDDAELQAALRVQLRKRLASEPSLSEELTRLLGEAAPTAVEVNQTQEVSGDHAAGVQVAGDHNQIKIR